MPRGRRSKLTDAVTRKFCAALRKGATRRAACGAVGIHESTFGRWMRAGEQAETGIQRAFRAAVLEAESTAERRYVNVLDEVAKNGEARDSDRIRAATFMLERRYGWTQRTEVTGAEGKPLEVASTVKVTPTFSDAQFERAEAAIRDGDQAAMQVIQAEMAARYGKAAEAK